METGTGPGPPAGPARPRRGTRPAGTLVAVVAVLTAGGCGSSAPARRSAEPPPAPTPVTAVPATTPPTSPWDTLPPSYRGSRLGPWELKDRFLVLAALADQGLATVSAPGKPTTIIFRGELSIPVALRREGWEHVGDPDSWRGYVFDAYQGLPTAKDKLFEVTSPNGSSHQFVHPLAPHEMYNNSFAAVSPDGQWLVSGEWGEMDRLLVFPTPIVNPVAPVEVGVVGLTATIHLDHPVRDVQGCVFDSPTQLVCSSTDPGKDLWPTPYQLLQITLARPLDGANVDAHVTSLGELPQLSDCTGTYEVEGLDYSTSGRTLRVEVIPPGACGLSVAVYEYHRVSPPKSARVGGSS